MFFGEATSYTGCEIIGPVLGFVVLLVLAGALVVLEEAVVLVLVLVLVTIVVFWVGAVHTVVVLLTVFEGSAAIV